MSRITTTTLDCRAALIVEPMAGVRSAGLTWTIPTGLARDPASRVGLSVLWTEMLERGSGGLDSRAFADALDTLGTSASVGAGTFTHTIGAAMLGSRLGEVLPLIVDMVREPRFDADDLKPARDLCLQAIESLADDPSDRVMVDLRDHHAPEPINRSSYGTADGIAAVTIDDVRTLWAGMAKPGGSIIAVAGDVDPARVGDQLNELLAGWEGQAEPVSVSNGTRRGLHHRAEATNQCHIALAWDSPREGDETAWLERITTSVLSGGMSGRLFTEVREKRGLCYSVYASYGADRDYGRSVAYAGTTPQRAQQTLDVLHEQLARINTPEGRITRDEFDRAVVGMKSRLVMSGESTGARASALAGDWRKLGRVRSLDELTSRIDAITLDEVNDYLSTRTLGEVTICTLGPDGLKMPS